MTTRTTSAKRTLFTGALILTGANIISRLLGFAYRIFMSNAIGPEGMGLYQLIMPIYALAWSISCSGLTTAISKLVATEKARGRAGNMRRILYFALLLAVVISIVLMVVIFAFAGWIGEGILNDARVVLPLRILAFSIPFMAAGSCIRGYFFGLQRPALPAASQIIEQFVRMAIIFALAGTFIPRGLEYAAAAAVIGIVAGEAVSFVFVGVAYRLHRKWQEMDSSSPVMSVKSAYAALFAISLPLTLNRITGSFLSAVENVLIPQRLQQFGLSPEEAMSQFGKITGMAMPLIFFPSAILTALSISLVPAISESVAQQNEERITSTVSKSILFTSVIAFGAALIFVVFPSEIGRIVYNQDLASILLILGLMCPFWYLNITFSGILNGLGEQVFIFRNSLIASIINIAFVFFFVPRYGTIAFLVGWFVGLIIVTYFDIEKIREITCVRLQVLRWFFKPALAALAAGLIVNYAHGRFVLRMLSERMALIFSLGVLMGIYGVFVVLSGCIRWKDIQFIFNRK